MRINLFPCLVYQVNRCALAVETSLNRLRIWVWSLDSRHQTATEVIASVRVENCVCRLLQNRKIKLSPLWIVTSLTQHSPCSLINADACVALIIVTTPCLTPAVACSPQYQHIAQSCSVNKMKNTFLYSHFEYFWGKSCGYSVSFSTLVYTALAKNLFSFHSFPLLVFLISILLKTLPSYMYLPIFELKVNK